MFDSRGPAQRRNDRSGVLQRREVRSSWVDLGVVSAGPEDPRAARGTPAGAGGVDLRSRVPGELLAWERASTGEWVGWVCLPIREAHEVTYVYQYVQAEALSPREPPPARGDVPLAP